MKKSKLKNGFTVLETMISIVIIGAVIGGVSSAVRSGIYALSIAKEEVRAFYLAQEAVEMIRNRRDSNQLDSLHGGASVWLTGIADQVSDPCYFGKTCRIDSSLSPTANGAFADCALDSGGVCEVLKQDPATYVYGYVTGNDTMYTRTIQLENAVANQISISVQVIWRHAGVIKSFKAKTLLANWF